MIDSPFSSSDSGNTDESVSKQTIWVGAFDSWEQAVAEADKFNAGHTLDQISFASGRWLQRQSGILRHAKLGMWDRYSTLPVLAALIYPSTIVDFGGGSGWTYWALNEHIRDSLTQYVIVEIDEAINAFSDCNSDDRVRFCTSKDLSLGEPGLTSILYANSFLQYLPDDEILRSIASDHRPNYIVIDDMQVASRSFICHQRYYGQVIVCRFTEASQVSTMLLAEGYRLTGNWPYPKTYAGPLAPELCTSSQTEDEICEILAPRSLLFTRT